MEGVGECVLLGTGVGEVRGVGVLVGAGTGECDGVVLVAGAGSGGLVVALVVERNERLHIEQRNRLGSLEVLQ